MGPPFLGPTQISTCRWLSICYLRHYMTLLLTWGRIKVWEFLVIQLFPAALFCPSCCDDNQTTGVQKYILNVQTIVPIDWDPNLEFIHNHPTLSRVWTFTTRTISTDGCVVQFATTYIRAFAWGIRMYRGDEWKTVSFIWNVCSPSSGSLVQIGVCWCW